MQKYGLKGTFNINGGMFAEQYEGIEKGKMTKQEALELYIPSEMEVVMHGYQHVSLGVIDPSLALHDILNDKKVLENMFGRVINGMAYANASYNDE